MTKEVAPQFRDEGDRVFAEALSELVLRPDDFVIANTDSLTATGVFPPVSADIGAAMLAFRDDGDNLLWGMRASAPEGTYSDQELVDVFLDRYESVESVWAQVLNRAALTPPGADNLIETAKDALRDEAKRAELRTTAAFVLHLAKGNPREVYAGIYIPVDAPTAIPLALRNKVTATRPGERDVASSPDMGTEGNEAFGNSLRQNDPRLKCHSLWGCCADIPPLETIRTSLKLQAD